jgi:hypothetical protein
LTAGTKPEYRTKTVRILEAKMMVRLARESLAFVSVVGFVWMVCSAARLVA